MTMAFKPHFSCLFSNAHFYGGPQLSHQIQIHHIKYKFTTSNTNSPHQIRIHHIKYKFTTSNTNVPHQIQIHHIKNKFTTSKTNSPHQNQKHRLNGQRLMNESYLQFSLGLHPTAILFLHITGPTTVTAKSKVTAEQNELTARQH